MQAALAKSATFGSLMKSMGQELLESQLHAAFPTSQMLNGSEDVCQATISLATLASQRCSGFSAEEVPQPVSLQQLKTYFEPAENKASQGCKFAIFSSISNVAVSVSHTGRTIQRLVPLAAESMGDCQPRRHDQEA